ncbi:SusC/RagA family TonB-linked outer membrane protein [Hymenobacter agri]
MTGLLQQVHAQNRSISGRVTDRSNGQGLPGVTVLVKGTTVGVSTNVDGSFSLDVPASATTLSISSVGYVTVEQPIGSNSTFTVSLAPDAKQLGEVVVTGALGVQRQAREIGYATSTLDTKEINQARVTNVTTGLTGKVAGLQIQQLSSGINPSVRVTLRGTRSLTGNNQALVVLDGVIVPNDVLTALSPDDIDNITVLKGANAASLYGSDASNGALIITTRKGGGAPVVTISQTSTFESLSFLPKFQTEFGPGANTYTNTLPKFTTDGSVDSGYETQYQGFENQQYGPRFDGHIVPFGEKLENGDVQMIAYEARPDEKRKFFNTGYQAQNNISFSTGDEHNKFFVSYQNLHNNGIIPKDKLDRNTIRLNASHDIGRLTVGFDLSYSQKRIDQTSNSSRDNSVYWNVFNTTVMAPLTAYKDWQNDPYANPNGFYNAYYFNPYWIIDNNRTKTREDYIIGDVNLGYKLAEGLKLQSRTGATFISQAVQATQDKFIYSPYVSANTNKSGAGTPGFVSDVNSSINTIYSDLFLSLDKTFGDYTVRAIVGTNLRQSTSSYVTNSSTGLAVPGLFNLQNRVGELVGGDGRFTNRSQAVFADVTLGFKEFLFLHGSGRNEWDSRLLASNRSFFFPGADVSVIFTQLVPTLKDASWIDYGKVRGGITRVGQVNLNSSGVGVAASNGAYVTQGTPFGLGAGYPFGPLTSFSYGNQIISPNIKPEFTRSIEAGIELSFLKRRVSTSATYYNQKSTDQTLSAGVPRSTGYSGILLNAGEVRNSGVEVDLNIVPVRLDNGLTVTIGGNYNYNTNKVVSITPDIHELPLTTGGNANVYAIEGQPFPVIRGSVYQRGADGRVLMTKTADPITGETRYFPLKAPDTQILGNTLPKDKYGFNASIAFKGVTLAAQAEYRTNYVVYHSIGEDLDFTGGSQRSASYGRADFVYPNSSIPTLDANGNVTGYTPNVNGLTPGGSEFWASAAYNTSIAENYITSGKFFKLREVSLSYNLPSSLINSIGFVKGASLNLFGRNIFTWVPKENQYTDPEFNFGNSNSNAVGINTSFQTPPTKFYGASLSANF